MHRLQFSLRALLILMLAVACFFGGIRFEREMRRREDLAREKIMSHVQIKVYSPTPLLHHKPWSQKAAPKK